MNRWAALALATVALSAAAGVVGWHNGIRVTDTVVVLDGVGTADRCISMGRWNDCNDAKVGSVGYFPLLQYLPAYKMKLAGMTKDDAAKALAALSGAAFVLLVAIGWLVLAHLGRERLGALFAAAVLSSGFLWYADVTFAEALVGLMTILLVAAILVRPRVALVAAAALLAGISKESAPPFLALLGAAAILVNPRDWRRTALALAGGLAAATLVNCGFNVFRYGHVWNDFYVPSGHPPASRWPDIGAAMLVSPNGGLLWFWPAALVLLWFARGTRAAWAAIAILGALVVFFTTWYAPFGWQAWGPRLIAPWVPAALLIALAAAPPRPPPKLVWLTAGIGFVSSLGQFASYLKPRGAFGLFKDPCVADTDRYYPCLSHLAWGAKPVLLRAVEALSAPQVLLALVFACAVAAMVLLPARASRRGSGA